MSKFIKNFWYTPHLPEEHTGKGKDGFRRAYYRIFVHPIKRRLARYYLKLLQSLFGLRVVAITGSAGKTTTKEMVRSILKKDGKTVASYANIDPVYNIPTSIFKCSPLTKYLVLEMGIEYVGEMDFYLWLARPDVGVLTNVYPTHTEFFKDEEGVYKEKRKLILNLDENDKAVLNWKNKYTKKLGEKTKAEVFWFNKKGKIDAKEVELLRKGSTKFTLQSPKSNISIQLPILGRQFVQNALAAAAVSESLGLPLSVTKKGLEDFHLPAHRMKVIKKKDYTLIDDSYNSNPEAARAAIDTLVEIAGKKAKVAVMGDMLELGELEKEEHKKLGKYLVDQKIDVCVFVGKLSKYAHEEAKNKIKEVYWVKDAKSALDKLKPHLKNEAYILIKASRSIGLDELVKRIS